MYVLEPFKIDLKGLEQGLTELHFHLDDGFFEAVKSPDVRRGNLQTALTITRTGDFFDLNFHTEGTVTVACDLCLEDMEQPIVADSHWEVRFGEVSSEDDDLVTVAENEGMLDVAWHIYESVALSVPIRHVHAPGKCNPAMMKILKDHSASRRGAGNADGEIDSRWAALKALKTKE